MRGPFHIPPLGRLIPPAEEKYDPLIDLPEVHPITGAVVDPQLHDPFTMREVEN